MQVFRRIGSTVHVNPFSAIFNVVLLYGFFFTTDEILRRIGNAKRGIFCVDPTIHYTPKSSTVSSLHHRIYNISLMVVCIFLVEAFRQFNGNSTANLVYRVSTIEIPKYAVIVLSFVGYSQVGYIMNEVLVKFVKGQIGRPRPYFMAACKPEPIKACQTANPMNVYVPITEYTCTGAPDKVEEARRSFYSGHSTVTMYCAFWTVLYLQARLKPALGNSVVVAIMQTLIMFGGLFICCSRISDHKHHWEDVLVGITVGMSIAAVSAKWYGDIFKKPEVGEDAEEDFPTEKENEVV